MTIHNDSHAPTTFTLHNFGHCHGLHLMCLALLLLLWSATAQLPSRVAPPPPSVADPFSRLKFDKNMAIVMVILVVVFFMLGFLSVYTRQCAERRSRGRLDLTLPIVVSGGRSRGLDREIINTFPTLVYSAVKGLKIGRNTLECAVCLNEFEDDETLRLIPKCSHVFHPDCIDMWLASHSTCPLCRAKLIPRSGEASFVAIQIPTPGVESHDGDEVNRNRMAEESPMRDGKRGLGSRSRGFGNGIFPRSHSTGHSLEGENWERFTLRLPEDARKEIVNRTNSCVTFRRERSERRSRSVGVDEGFGGERWGFTMRPPFLSRTASNEAPMPMPMDNIGERSSDPLFPGNKD